MKAKLINPICSLLCGQEVNVIREVDISDPLFRRFERVKEKIYITRTGNVENWHFASNLEFVNEK